MRVEKIALSGFRNYEFETAEFDPGTNVISGQNAQGKTNLLESVYMLSCGRSLEEGFNFPPGGADAALDKMGLPTAPPPERLVQSLYKGL